MNTKGMVRSSPAARGTRWQVPDPTLPSMTIGDRVLVEQDFYTTQACSTARTCAACCMQDAVRRMQDANLRGHLCILSLFTYFLMYFIYLYIIYIIYIFQKERLRRMPAAVGGQRWTRSTERRKVFGLSSDVAPHVTCRKRLPGWHTRLRFAQASCVALC